MSNELAHLADVDPPLRRRDISGFVRIREVWVGLALCGVSVALLVFPFGTTVALSRLLGLGLLAFAVQMWPHHAQETQHRTVAAAERLVAVVAAVLGAVLLAIPQRNQTTLSQLLALVVIIRGAVPIVQAAQGKVSWKRAIFYFGWHAALAVVLASNPYRLLRVLAGLGALLASTTGVNLIGATARGQTLDERRQAGHDPEQLQFLRSSLIFSGDNATDRYGRFMMLMGSAAAIASFGLIADSGAVIIGAMLIAPLMTPLMGMALATAMGWPNAYGRALAAAVSGIGLAILVGLVAGASVSWSGDPASSAEILGRTSPTFLDLLIAIAAGAAGAYALSRPDVSDSLPGVAIAIALVPPLATVGICASQSEWTMAAGALLLFLTNALSILFVGGFVFVLTRTVPEHQLEVSVSSMRSVAASAMTIAVMVIAALGLNGAQAARDEADLTIVSDVTLTWLGDNPAFDYVRSDVNDGVVNVTLAGEGDPAHPEDLAAQLAVGLDRAVELNLVVEQRRVATVTAVAREDS